MKKTSVLMVVLAVVSAPLAFGAVGCELNDPDRDVKRFFPESTGYKTTYASIAGSGGEALLKKVEAKLGDTFKGMFETVDVPYTFYHITRGKEVVGYIHGVNQKGQYGGIQVFLALDAKGVVRAFYFQKLSSRQAKLLRDQSFGTQFAGLSLKDFDAWDPAAGSARAGSRVAGIRNPAPEADADFKSALRGVKKNLILCEVFLLGNPALK